MAIDLAEAIKKDRELAAEITPTGWTDPLLVARDAAMRHNARIDAPERKGQAWVARARGVRVDANQVRHDWAVVGEGKTPDAAVEDLIAKLEAKPVAAPAIATCPTCGQALP